MIDCETIIYNQLKDAVTAALPDLPIHWSAVPVTEQSAFPFVMCYEIDNAVNTDYSDSGNIERIANLSYQVEIYSNRDGKRMECKTIARAIDDAFNAMGLARMSLQSVGNLNDNTIYRMVGRYSCSVDADLNIYKRR